MSVSLKRFHIITLTMLRCTRGSVLPMTAAALVPMLAMVGGSIDISRTWMARSRLQHACDAGVLAGRKAMRGRQFDPDSRKIAHDYFSVNYNARIYGSRDTHFTAEKVEGTSRLQARATTELPLLVMGIFGFDSIRLTAECEAEVNLGGGNADITLVLDVSNSMNSRTGSVSRIEALRRAVLNFYDAMEEANAKDAARIRYAFIPYTLTVNAGELLYDKNPKWLIGGKPGETWEYQSRIQRPGKRKFEYKPIKWPVDKYIHSIKPEHPAVDNPTDFATKRVRWKGCIMERQTHPSDIFTYDLRKGYIVGRNRTKRLYDLDLNLEPRPHKTETRWPPYRDEVMFERSGYYGKFKTRRSEFVNCPPKATKLTEMKRQQVRKYLQGLHLGHFTYHDIGLAWGGRIASPHGIFKENVNEDPGNDLEVQRHLIFMTDGWMYTGDNEFSAWGPERFQKNLAWGHARYGDVNNTHNVRMDRIHIARFEAICDAVKAEGIRLWVIAFETGLTDSLRKCASPGSALLAKGAKGLEKQFRKIGDQVIGLRLTR